MKLAGYIVNFVYDPPITFCAFGQDDGGTWALGYANCSKKDTFNRITGRKVALADALERNFIEKPIRTKIWEDYKKKMRVK